MQTRWPPTHDSIFGDTYAGVPNPNVPHKHPYPTRYHGPNYTVPGVAQDTFVERPYAEVPYFGFEGDGALGELPRIEHVLGGGLLDAAAGAGVGWVVGSADDQVVWMIAGAVGGYIFGLLGIATVGAAGVVAAQRRGITT
jgi:hypothetical protein